MGCVPVCVGLIRHEAMPEESVIALHVSPMPSVNVTFLPAIGAPPSGSVSFALAVTVSW